ncbi:hypothetical protein J4E93_005961 [Alternaria ventricosa]|uniref:uncharacterized protein n=1 Tax=Alternaria ventricosa TaxID=1187951 RepID=UPI0020C25789|nr:uncharacterized protein J4E93_005961 [Alternaria ventricosa]KAI4645161.1 hypothetical protein J4E93_005961 [Alternaria ventricosa]
MQITTLGPLLNPSKFGCDGKAINTIHCFTAILDQTNHCTNADCEGSHVPPIRQVFEFILCLQAEHHYENGDVDDKNRTFLYNVLKAYFLKHFRHKTLPVIIDLGAASSSTLTREIYSTASVRSVPFRATCFKEPLSRTCWRNPSD